MFKINLPVVTGWFASLQGRSRMTSEEPTETDLRDPVYHAANVVEYVDEVAADALPQGTYDEFLVAPELVRCGLSVTATGYM